MSKSALRKYDVSPVAYSTQQTRILELLLAGRPGRRVSVFDVISAAYGGEVPPICARQSVNLTMTHLMHRVRKNGEKFEVMKYAVRGPRPAEYWIEEVRR